MKINKIFTSFLVLFSVIHYPFSAQAQVRPIYDYGAIGLGQLLKKINNTKSVMMVGAHPDDEDSALLAYLARGENARTAYLSLTRGDGGQNLIGDELFESLGVIRTEELLQARRLDGAEQYFTRAFDYGFSKTLAEAKEKWDEKIVLCDAVEAIRLFRPLVVISRFAGTPADGHGQHQYAGYISPIAVKAAADSTQCKDAGELWQVKKFYIEQGFRATDEPTLKIDTGQYDPLIGRSYFEIAMEGRSQHKTQEQGVLELKGGKFSGLNPVENNAPKTPKETDIFDGLDVSIKGLAKNTDNSEEPFAKNLSQLQTITKNLEKENLSGENLLSMLAQGWKSAHDAELSTRNPQSKFFLQGKQNEFEKAIKLAAGIQIDALSNKETFAAGENFTTSVRVFYPNSEKISVREISLEKYGWTISKIAPPKDENQNSFRREEGKANAFFNVSVARKAELTQPYWMKNGRDGALFKTGKNEHPIVPFSSPLLEAVIKIEIDGTEIDFSQPVEYRFADDIRGEIRREINIVPAVSISLDQNLLIIPQSAKSQTKKIVMNITNNSSQTIDGEAAINAFAKWKTEPLSQNFSLKKREKTSLIFEVTIPANAVAGSYEILPTVNLGDNFYSDEMHTIEYPHIQTHRFYNQSEAKATVLDLKTAPVKVGYISGSGDRVADAIRQMNFDLEMLNEVQLSNGDLSKFDVIVVGIRASQARPDFVANHQRLLDYVKNGGTLLVQYQNPVYQSLLPFPAKMDARVTDENAKVTILDPADPIFNFPNKITDKDFEGWVQERNLYAFSTFDANYKPLLESHDLNEPENKGGLVVAKIGKGNYIYCSYAFFRQLPNGVPGAYRLFANLLSVPKNEIKRLRKK